MPDRLPFVPIDLFPYDPDPPAWAREPRVIPGHVQVAPDDEEYDPPAPPQLAGQWVEVTDEPEAD